MILMEKENMVDGSCYVAVYENRKIGNSSKRGYALVGKTETIAIDPKYIFPLILFIVLVLNLLDVLL